MGDRGSKSVGLASFGGQSVTVKEQRVDGSSITLNIMVRCILSRRGNPVLTTNFVDGEGSFTISVNPHSRYSTGYRVKATFSIGLHERDLPLLQLIKEFFGVGSITKSSINGIQ